jgi:hypothetical protein
MPDAAPNHGQGPLGTGGATRCATLDVPLGSATWKCHLGDCGVTRRCHCVTPRCQCATGVLPCAIGVTRLACFFCTHCFNTLEYIARSPNDRAYSPDAYANPRDHFQCQSSVRIPPPAPPMAGPSDQRPPPRHPPPRDESTRRIAARGPPATVVPWRFPYALHIPADRDVHTPRHGTVRPTSARESAA